MNIHIFICYMFFSFFGAVICNSAYTRNHLEKKVLSLLDKWRNCPDVPGTCMAFPLPALKTINIKGLSHGRIKEGLRNFEIDFSVLGDIHVTGLNNFSVDTIMVNPTNSTLFFYMSISIPTLLLEADKYELQGSYSIWPLSGAGTMKIEAQNTQAILKAHFDNFNNKSTSLKDLSLEFAFGKTKTYLQNGPYLFQDEVNSLVVDLLTVRYQEKITNDMRDYIESFANKYLCNVTLEQFLDTIVVI